jgi:hypothetical protein
LTLNWTVFDTSIGDFNRHLQLPLIGNLQGTHPLNEAPSTR